MEKSIWLQQKQLFSTAKLKEDRTCEVCIIGGGLTGIYTAYLLAKSGHDVILLEAREEMGTGITAHSTGKLTVQHGTKYAKLSTSTAQGYYNANRLAIERALQDMPTSLFRNVISYVYATTEKGKTLLQQEYNAYQKIGIPSHATNETELPFDITLAIGIDDQTQIDPVDVVTHFAKLADQAGAKLYTDTRATTVQENFLLLENGVRVSFKKLIVCTHYPVTSIQRLYSAKFAIRRSYLTATPTSELLNGQYISADGPSRTMRTYLKDGKPYFIYGGGDHAAGTVTNTDDYYELLFNELQSKFELPAPPYLWSAQDVQTPDDVPYVGPLVKTNNTIYIATGYDKWGLSNSLVAGELLSSYVNGTSHEAKNIYTPLRHNGLHAMQKILKNSGFIGIEFFGGHLTRTNAPKCTHLGCKTRWNEGDNTWDCPCHGSRFDADGNIVEGPAVYPLQLKKGGI